MKLKKILSLTAVTALLAVSIIGCGTDDYGSSGNTDPNTSSSSFDSSKEITVVSREDGSGTRTAFIELLGIEEKGANGSKKDNTTDDAIVANKTDVMMTNIAGDKYAIGYISLGSLNNTVKALKIDGVEPTTETVKDGSYKVARPFNIATKKDLSEVAQDFISFILSKEGQDVVVENKYISVNDTAEPYSGTKPSGKITIAGSSSVTPVMEKLKEAYTKINSNATIEIQMTDSTAGMTGAIDGTCDIGMASRELKDTELEQLTGTQIALDGIAVIVNPENTFDNLSSANVKDIFVGNITAWDEISQ